MKLTPFKDLAEGLAAHGIASIRYDKRSFAHGMKMIRDKNTVITVKEETIEDAVMAAREESIQKENSIVCAFGSLYCIGDVIACLKGK